MSKYIVVELNGAEEIFIFPKKISHDRMMESIGAVKMGSFNNWRREYRSAVVVSAGFIDNGVCHGRSETLKVSSRGTIDTQLFLTSVDCSKASA